MTYKNPITSENIITINEIHFLINIHTPYLLSSLLHVQKKTQVHSIPFRIVAVHVQLDDHAYSNSNI